MTQRHITILATNDIHGGIEPSVDKNGSKTGGMAFWAGSVRAIKQGLQARYGDAQGVLVVDAGDQFQGTLISNHNEGELVFRAMNEVGYDAAITGNHDYDFGPYGLLDGPEGWLESKVTPKTKDQDPLGNIKRLAAMAKFPLISANTYVRSKMKDTRGNPLLVDNQNCTAPAGAEVNWEDADENARPSFLKPYIIKDVAGVKVALIGIDNPGTPTTTMAENVSDLCFDEEARSYLRARKKLENEAQVFVMVIHDGDVGKDSGVTQLVKKLTDGPTPMVDAVVSGHTHVIYNKVINGIPLIQSGNGGKAFGRVDLVWDSKLGRVDQNQTNSWAGLSMNWDQCPGSRKSNPKFCSYSGAVRYEDVEVRPSAPIEKITQAERAIVAPIANENLGQVLVRLKKDRIDDSPVAEVLTDAFRGATGADISFLNAGGLRANIEEGVFTFEKLFQVLPISNQAVLVGPVPATKLIDILNYSIKTCGSHGALLQSGLKIEFQRNCKGGGDDPEQVAAETPEVGSSSAESSAPESASPVGAEAVTETRGKTHLLHVETVGGIVIYDINTHPNLDPAQSFKVATLDFLVSGGAGNHVFGNLPMINGELGVASQLIANYFRELVKKGQPAQLDGKLDGRWIDHHVSAAPSSGNSERP